VNSGLFTVSEGRLIVTNSTGSGTGVANVVVNSGATLGGTGSIAGNITVNSGGILRGGASIGTLGINTVSFATGARIAVEIADGSTPGAISTGDSTLGTLPNPTSNNYLNKLSGTVSGLGGVNIIVDLNNITFANPLAMHSYQIGQGFDDQSMLNIIDQSRFTFVNPGSNGPVDVSLTGNSMGEIFLNFAPIPEPMLLAPMAFAVIALRRRCK
jgi:uncharacterized protein with beta-barrel porin domain